MAKTLGRDPTTNIYALLADESVSSETLSKGNKKGNTKKESESLQTPSGVVPTPAAKAQARKQKEEAAAKAAATLNAESGPLVGGTLEREHKKTGKLNRQQWNNSVDHPQQAPPNAGGGPRNIPPRQQGQGGADRDRGGEFSDRGRGGRGGGRRGGRGRSDRSLADRPPRLEENRNRDENNRGTDLSGEGHHPPRGREFDRHSQMRTPRQPYSKRAGAGKSNWGPEAEWEPAPTEEPAPVTVEAVAAPLTTEVIGGWGDEGNDPGAASSENPAWGAWDNEKLPEAALESAANTLAPPSQQDKGLEDFLEEKKKKAEQLAALLGKHEVRQVEGFQRYSPKEEPNSASQEKTEKVPSPTKKSGKGKEVIPHDKLGFHLKAAPGVRRGRGGRRGGGDEERGGGGGGGGEDHPQEPREDRPPREPRDDRPDRAPGRGGRGRGGGRLGGGSGGGYGGGGVRGNGGYRGSGGGRGRFGKKDFPPLEELTAST